MSEFEQQNAEDPSSRDQPHRDPTEWGRLIESLDVASCYVAIGSWLGHKLRAQVAIEDIWQETLWLSWRDRAQHEWRGLSAFRVWLLSIARHRVLDAARHRVLDAARRRGRGDAARWIQRRSAASTAAGRALTRGAVQAGGSQTSPLPTCTQRPPTCTRRTTPFDAEMRAVTLPGLPTSWPCSICTTASGAASNTPSPTR